MTLVLDVDPPEAASLALEVSPGACGGISTDTSSPDVGTVSAGPSPVCGLMSPIAAQACGLPEFITEDEDFVLVGEDGEHIYLEAALQVIT